MTNNSEPHKTFGTSNRTLLILAIVLMGAVLSIGTITNIGNWGNFTTGVNTPKVISTDIIANSTPWIDVRAYGAVCDGSTDDWQAIQNAINASRGNTVRLPPGTCAISKTINTTYPGQILEGSGRYWNSTLKVTAAVDAIVISGTYSELKNIYLNGNNAGRTGIVFYNAAESVVENVLVTDFLNNGSEFNISYRAPAGNNNHVHISRSQFQGNNMDGISVPLYQSDNNGVSLEDVYATSNTMNGTRIKGTQWNVISGDYEANGGYGISISNSWDATASRGIFIFNPWMETNVMGGIHGGGQSNSNMVFLYQNSQNVTNEGTSKTLALRANSLGILDFNNTYTSATVGAAGGASALPATPKGYLVITIDNTQSLIPYYAAP